jgi:hypothetical protein
MYFREAIENRGSMEFFEASLKESVFLFGCI